MPLLPTVEAEFGKWVELRRRDLGYRSREQFAVVADISERTLAAIEQGEGLLNRNRSTKGALARALQVSVRTLEALARGERVEVPPPVSTPAAGYNANAMPPDARHQNLKPIPVLGRSVAGHGVEEFDQGPEAPGYVYLPPGIAGGDPDAFAVQVTGDSMKPYLRPGDWCVCSPKAQEVQGGLYFIQQTGALDEANRLKLVFPVPDDDELLELRSTNVVKYPPVRVRRSDIGRPALVLYVIRPADNLGIY